MSTPKLSPNYTKSGTGRRHVQGKGKSKDAAALHRARIGRPR